jgi:hypothetical protein
VRGSTYYTGTSFVFCRILEALTKQPPRRIFGDVAFGLFKEISRDRLVHRDVHCGRRFCNYGWRLAIRKKEGQLRERERENLLVYYHFFTESEYPTEY